jgi:hypothetical protein
LRCSAQAKDGTSAAATGHHQQLQRTVARLTAQLKAAEALQAQQQAYVQQLAQELEQQQQQQGVAAGSVAGVQMTTAAADVARRPTAGSDVQELFLQVRKRRYRETAKCHIHVRSAGMQH